MRIAGIRLRFWDFCGAILHAGLAMIDRPRSRPSTFRKPPRCSLLFPPGDEVDMRGQELTFTIFAILVENADLARSTGRGNVECNANTRIKRGPKNYEIARASWPFSSWIELGFRDHCGEAIGEGKVSREPGSSIPTFP